MTANTQTVDFEDELSKLTDAELELLESIEGKNRHVSRAIAKQRGYTWKEVQSLRKMYLRSVGKGE